MKMKTKERKKVVLAILCKSLLYIVAAAMIFVIIILAWEKYDWFPSVKDIIRGVFIPMLLSGLMVFLLRHEFDVLKDKWKPFVELVIFLTGTLVIVNAGILAQEASVKVMKVESITELSDDEIKGLDYLQIVRVEPDTSSCNSLFDDSLIPSTNGSTLKLWLYQVCPLKDKNGVFVCTRTKETYPTRFASQSKKEQWKKDFVEQAKGSIKRVAPSAHFFKILHPSDDFEPYQAICTTHYGTIRTEDLVLLEICQPNVIERWEDNVLYIFISLLVGFSVLVITLMRTGVLNAEFRKSSEEKAF